MTIQQQVCTLEQAKRLKELGVVQESYFYVIADDDGVPQFRPRKECIEMVSEQCLEAAREEAGNPSQYSYSQRDLDEQAEQIFAVSLNYNGDDAPEGFYSAFTVAELGVMLSCAPEGWAGDDEYEPATIAEMYSAEWVAKVTIHLLETKLITAEEVNARLLTTP
jgi:hypothetical protein